MGYYACYSFFVNAGRRVLDAWFCTEKRVADFWVFGVYIYKGVKERGCKGVGWGVHRYGEEVFVTRFKPLSGSLQSIGGLIGR